MDSVFTVWFGNHRSWSKSHALYAGVNGLSHACAPLEPRRASQPIDVGLLNARAVKRKVWNEAESRAQSETGERRFFSSRLTCLTGVRGSRASRLRLLLHALPISLLILRKKNWLFCNLRRQEQPFSVFKH